MGAGSHHPRDLPHGWVSVKGMALMFLLEQGRPQARELCGPCCGLAERMREAHQAPEVAPHALGASLHYVGGKCLDISVITCPRDCAESPWACRAPTVPCSGKEGTSSQPSCSWFAPAPSRQYLTFASSYFAGTAHVTVMGMRCVPCPSSMAHFTPWPLTIRTPCPSAEPCCCSGALQSQPCHPALPTHVRAACCGVTA